jgi:hypothetical protein
VVRGTIELSGPLWNQAPPGATGRMRVIDGEGGVAATDVRVSGVDKLDDWIRRPWLVPRRILHRGGLGGETRDLLVVRPVVRTPGTRYGAEGRVSFDFPRTHPLSTDIYGHWERAERRLQAAKMEGAFPV